MHPNGSVGQRLQPTAKIKRESDPFHHSTSLLSWLIVVVQEEAKEVERLKCVGMSQRLILLHNVTTSDFDFDCRYQLVIQTMTRSSSSSKLWPP